MRYLLTLFMLLAIIAFSACETSVVMTPQEEQQRERPRVFSDSSRTPANSKAPVKSTARTDRRKEASDND